jgi:hypothetical protein
MNYEQHMPDLTISMKGLPPSSWRATPGEVIFK